MSRYIDLDNPKIHKMGRDKFGDAIYHIPPDTPLADVRKNVHGEWISTRNNVYPACYTIRCSICNLIAFYSGIEDNNEDCGYNFCPNCGAIMDGVSRDRQAEEMLPEVEDENDL